MEEPVLKRPQEPKSRVDSTLRLLREREEVLVLMQHQVRELRHQLATSEVELALARKEWLWANNGRAGADPGETLDACG
jgi:hypothetical protein